MVSGRAGAQAPVLAAAAAAWQCGPRLRRRAVSRRRRCGPLPRPAAAVNDDNSVITLHPKTMETLEFFRGDTVLLKVGGGRCVAAGGAQAGQCLK